MARGVKSKRPPKGQVVSSVSIKTDSWDILEPGFMEIDCVAHCGNSGEGEFI